MYNRVSTLIFLLFGILSAQNDSKARSFLVKVDKVSKGTIEEFVYTYGRVTGMEEAPVIPPMPGRVVSILKREGEKVSREEVIALLDREIPGVKTEYLQVKSPIDGILTIINGRIGQYTLQTQPFAYVVSEEQMVEVSLGSEDLVKVREGAKAYISAGGKIVNGRVISKSVALDPLSLTGKVRIKINDGSLPYGSIAQVKIVVREKNNVLIVPESALVEKGNKFVVYVVKGEIVREIPVEVGIVSENKAEVRGDLNSGDLVVTVGAQGLYDGAKVSLE
ncbi:MAG: efflux RND transporter periplasmic adaptor subunit, partial [candidate division WOR-3 bacterium]